MRFWKCSPMRRIPPERCGTRYPLFTLMVLAPLSGEMLSGSMPPLEWLLNPFGVVLIVMLYGSGAVLIREFVRRWGQGWPSILLLGAAYAIFEEGLVVRSFFDPTWQDLDILAEHGRWLGVNWVWSLGLTWFHAIISITIPILLVELIYPAQRNRLWVTRRGLKIHAALFGIMLPIGMAFEMDAPPLGYVGCTLLIAGLVWLAYRWPRPEPGCAAVTPPCPRRVMGFGFLGMAGLVTTMWIIPHLDPPALLTILAICALPVWAVWQARRLGAAAWTPLHRWAAAAGALSVWTVLAFLSTAVPDMVLTGVIFIVLLWRVGLLVD